METIYPEKKIKETWHIDICPKCNARNFIYAGSEVELGPGGDEWVGNRAAVRCCRCEFVWILGCYGLTAVLKDVIVVSGFPKIRGE